MASNGALYGIIGALGVVVVGGSLHRQAGARVGDEIQRCFFMT